jgi:glucoamylase
VIFRLILLFSPANTHDGRTGKDANTILAAIHTFDVTLGCDAATFQPCSDKALANLKAVVDSFRWYNINRGIPQGTAVAVGRYAEDVYYNGNPWYLNTLAVAEQLYDALYTWDQQGSLTVTQTSLAFFRDLVPGISAGTYNAGSSTYKTVFNAVSAYAEGFVDVVATYVPEDGSMAEQYHKDSGAPLGASDLTWSYASFLTATSRRAGIVPRPWANETTISIPSTCQRTTAAGSYTRATKTTFPQSQTPIGGVPAPTTTQEPCATPTAVDVTFEVHARTQFGQTIKIVGDARELGAWDTSKAVTLSPSQYTDTNPVWKGTIKLQPGQDVKYKYINVNQDGSLTWEVDPNRQYVVPRACRKSMIKKDAWRS